MSEEMQITFACICEEALPSLQVVLHEFHVASLHTSASWLPLATELGMRRSKFFLGTSLRLDFMKPSNRRDECAKEDEGIEKCNVMNDGDPLQYAVCRAIVMRPCGCMNKVKMNPKIGR